MTVRPAFREVQQEIDNASTRFREIFEYDALSSPIATKDVTNKDSGLVKTSTLTLNMLYDAKNRVLESVALLPQRRGLDTFTVT